jgi:hypothetical protein
MRQGPAAAAADEISSYALAAASLVQCLRTACKQESDAHQLAKRVKVKNGDAESMATYHDAVQVKSACVSSRCTEALRGTLEALCMVLETDVKRRGDVGLASAGIVDEVKVIRKFLKALKPGGIAQARKAGQGERDLVRALGALYMNNPLTYLY